MSYPSSLDLSFGSEKPTVDPQGRLSFGKCGGSLPTTLDELNNLIDEGKAVNVRIRENQQQEFVVNLGNMQEQNPEVYASLPQNYVGLVKKEWDAELGEQVVSELPTTVVTDPELVIKVTEIPGKAEYFMILKQAVV
jgi:hypothetical protein